jgi:antitoxin HigA-1
MGTTTINIGMKPSHPGDFVRTEILNELGLTVSKAAEVLGVRRATLSDLVNGKAGVSPEMALRIEKAFGVSKPIRLRSNPLSPSRMGDNRSTRSAVSPFEVHARWRRCHPTATRLQSSELRTSVELTSNAENDPDPLESCGDQRPTPRSQKLEQNRKPDRPQ